MTEIENILAKIQFVWEKNPELRIGQLLCNCANYGALYYSSNEDIIKLLEQVYRVDTSCVVAPEKNITDKTDTVAEKDLEIAQLKALVASLSQAVKKPSANKGRIYIHRNGQSKSIAEEDLKSYLSEGWQKGRGPKN